MKKRMPMTYLCLLIQIVLVSCLSSAVYAFHVPEIIISRQSGTLNAIETDLALRTIGPDIKFSRTYTPDSGNGMFGKDWTCSVQVRLYVKSDEMFLSGTPYSGIFSVDGQGVFRQEGRNYPLIRKEEDHFILESSNGEKFIFNSSGFLTKEISPNGKHLIFGYTESGDNLLLNKVVGETGPILTLHYKGLLCTKVEDPEGRIFKYKYSDNLLSGVIYPDGTKSHYRYKDGYLHKIETPSSLNASFGLGEGKRVESYTDISGNKWKYRYKKDGNWNVMTKRSDDGTQWTYKLNDNDTGRTVQILDPSGNASEWKYNKQGSLLESTDPVGAKTKYKYDDQGNITQKVNPIGLITRFEPDSQSGRIESITTPAGPIYKYKYNDAGNIEKITKPDGSAVNYTYNKSSDIITKKDEAGAITEYKRDYWGNVIEITYPNGSYIKRNFDSYGNLIEETDIRGLKRTFGYDKGKRLIWIEDITGKTQMVYDERGYLVSQENPSGRMILYKRDKLGRITTVANSSGYELRYTYDRYGHLVSTQRPDGTVIKNRYDKLSRLIEQDHFRLGQRRFLYDSTGRLTTVLFKDGTKEQREYDLPGRIISFTNRENAKTEYVYGKNGRISRIINPGGNTVRYEYNSRGFLNTVSYPDGAVVTREYGLRGELLKWTDGEGKTKRYEYNNEGQLVRAIDRNGKPTVMKYDKIGQLVQKEYPGKIIEELVYDKAGRVLSREITGAGKASYSYDLEGRLIESLGAPLKSFTREYSPEGRVSGIITPDGTSVQFTYDNMGNIATIRDQNGIEEKFTNDVKAHSMTYSDAHMKKSSFMYSEGKVFGINKPDGTVLEYVRDSLGNIIEERASDKLLSKRSYDKMGNVISAENEEGTFQYEYDPMGRIKRFSSSALSMELNYKYDHAGRLIQVLEKDPAGKSRMIHHSYDGVGRRIETTDWDGRKYHMKYNKAGRLASVVYPGDTVNGFIYGNGLKPIGEKLVIGDGNGSTEKEYQHDEWGRIKSIKSGGSLNSVFYDKAGRLAEVKDEQDSGLLSYTYDNKGNRLKGMEGKMYEYDKADQLVSYNDKGIACEYDANGNLISVTQEDKKTLYRYDAKDRLIEAKLASGDKIRFGYDPFGNLFRYEKNGKPLFFFNDGLNIYAVLDSEKKVLRRYLHGQGLDRPLARRGQEGIDYLIVNATGDVGATVSGTGKNTKTFRYLPFGNLVDKNPMNDKILPPFLYKGRPCFAELGMYNMRARWYLPSLGRFLTRDKLSYRLQSPQNLHAYLYSANDPVNYYDTTGTISDEVLGHDVETLHYSPMPIPEAIDGRLDLGFVEIGLNPFEGTFEITGKIPLDNILPGLNVEGSLNMDIGTTGNAVVTRLPFENELPYPIDPMTEETYFPTNKPPTVISETQLPTINKAENPQPVIQSVGGKAGLSLELGGIIEFKGGVGVSSDKGIDIYGGGAGGVPLGKNNLGLEGSYSVIQLYEWEKNQPEVTVEELENEIERAKKEALEKEKQEIAQEALKYLEMEAEAKAKSKVEADEKVKVLEELNQLLELEAEAEAKSKAEAETKAKVLEELNQLLELEAEAEAKSKAEAETKAKAEEERKPEPTVEDIIKLVADGNNEKAFELLTKTDDWENLFNKLPEGVQDELVKKEETTVLEKDNSGLIVPNDQLKDNSDELVVPNDQLKDNSDELVVPKDQLKDNSDELVVSKGQLKDDTGGLIITIEDIITLFDDGNKEKAKALLKNMGDEADELIDTLPSRIQTAILEVDEGKEKTETTETRSKADAAAKAKADAAAAKVRSDAAAAKVRSDSAAAKARADAAAAKAKSSDLSNVPQRAKLPKVDTSLSGIWYAGGAPPAIPGGECRIAQKGNDLTIRNEHGMSSRARLINRNTIEAIDWSGLKGNLSSDKKRINWGNSTFWWRK